MAALQVITHRLPFFVSQPLKGLIGDECYHSLIYNTNFGDSACIQYSVSKALGFGIVLGGSIVKVPQIIKIVRSSSARGLSLSSYLLDTAATGITVAYNVRNEFPWSTYGESVFLLIQNIVIINLIVLYSPTSNRYLLLLILGALSISAYLLSSPVLTLPTLKLLLSASIPLSLSSKLPQIISNFNLGHTGQISAFLVFNSLAGCLARVYTTSTETGDSVLWWGFALGALLNGVIAAQMIASWNHEAGAAEKVKEKVEDEESEKIEVHHELPRAVSREVETPVKKVQQGASPKVSRTSSPASAKRYVRKLE